VKLKFLGATQSVTGSMFLVTTENNYSLLMDCGMYQGEGPQTNLLNAHLGVNPKKIDAVILSHAHIDHSGRLPLLVSQGFKGKIYCTSATSEIAEALLLDSYYIIEHELQKTNELREKYHQKKIKPLYTLEDVKRTFRMFHSLKYMEKVILQSELSFHLTHSGHILGSSSIHLEFKSLGRTKLLTFTGDIGRYNDLMMPDPDKIPSADFLICESTYGNKKHKNYEQAKVQLFESINETCHIKKGKLLIAAFSLGRTQEILYVLNDLKRQNLISSSLPVYLDSPLAIEITNISKKYYGEFSASFQSELVNKNDPFNFDGLFLIDSIEESKKLNDHKDPCIIIAASGMMDAGRIQYHLANCISNNKNSVLAVGYCTPESIGGQLLTGVNQINLFNHEYTVNAKISSISSFSAHADQAEMLKFLKSQDKFKLNSLFLVHGTKNVKEEWKQKLIQEGYRGVIIPKVKEEFLLL